MIVLANDLRVVKSLVKTMDRYELYAAYLQYIADLECNACLGAGYKLVIQRIIIELCTNKNLRKQIRKQRERERRERERENLLVADTANGVCVRVCVCVPHQNSFDCSCIHISSLMGPRTRGY